MIHQSETKRSKFAYEYSLQWASSVFRNGQKNFMILTTYADESYDERAKPIVIVVAGFIVPSKNWEKFIRRWQKVLNDFKVPYFHFCEFSQKKHNNFKKDVYSHLSNKDRDRFLYKLALVASDLGFPVGGAYQVKQLSEDQIKTAYRTFFKSVSITFDKMCAKNDKVEFVFDTNRDKTWLLPREAALAEFVKQGYPFAPGVTSKSYLDILPIQAADLHAFAMRQNAERLYRKEREPMAQPRLLDLIIEKNRHDVHNFKISHTKWCYWMKKVVKHFNEWKKTYPSKDYRPLVHCPFLKNPKSIN